MAEPADVADVTHPAGPAPHAWPQAPVREQRRPFPLEVVVVSVVAVGAITWLIVNRHHLAGPALVAPIVIVTGATLNILSPRFRALFTRLAKKVGAVAGTAIGFVLFGVLSVLVILLPWAVQRVLRSDPLGTTDGWSPRRRQTVRPGSPWAPNPQLEPPPKRARITRTATTVVVVAVLLMALPVTREAITGAFQEGGAAHKGFRLFSETHLGSTDPPLREPVPPGIKEKLHAQGEPFAAHEGDTWWDGTYETPQGWGFDPSVGYRPQDLHRFMDFKSPLINVVNGHRSSWVPPPCQCKRLKVWVYGGSTTYGLDQRDTHTISSELARAAYAHGITIDVSNRGNPGHQQWLEAEHFAWDLTQEAPPDLVVFYDGVNEASNEYAYSDLGIWDSNTPFDFTTIGEWNKVGRSKGPVPKGPPGSKMIGYATTDNASLRFTAGVTIKKYNRARQMSRTTAKRHGIPVAYAWQPDRYTRPIVLSEPHYDSATENNSRLQEQVLDDLIPKDVINLTDALDKSTAPMFVDDVHHNELAARLIGEALFARLEPKLRKLERG